VGKDSAAAPIPIMPETSSTPYPSQAGTPLLDQLIEAGHLIPSGVDGVYGRGGAFEQVLEGIDRLITRLGHGEGAEVMRFPPGIARRTFEESEYLKGFPHFAGTIHSFCGDERGHREMLRCVAVGNDWTKQQSATDLVLTPAACYPVYAIAKRRGPVPPQGWLMDVGSYCFRREPSLEPTRMQMFRQREFVRIGTPPQIAAFRDDWMQRAKGLIERLGLPCSVDVANDPFFGRIGTLMANNQREQELKFELLIPVNDGAGPTACGSVNCHLDHFGYIWGLVNEAGVRCHTACCAFGMERLTIAMFRHHGLNLAQWPGSLRDLLEIPRT
jgi:seryl-tRNA synthetase